MIAPSVRPKNSNTVGSEESVKSHILALEKHVKLLSQSEDEDMEKNGEL